MWFLNKEARRSLMKVLAMRSAVRETRLIERYEPSGRGSSLEGIFRLAT